MASAIEDYALLGDCQTAALVSREGSIDWLCLPRFDSGACFAALLGTPEHGRWLLAPRGGARRTRRRYHEGTLILETAFETEDGVASVIDFMPIRASVADLVRIVVGREGTVAMRGELLLRQDTGRVAPWIEAIEGGMRFTCGPDAVRLLADVPLRREGPLTTCDFEVRAGERRAFDLTWHASHEAEPAPIDAHRALRETESWWRDWSRRSRYEGPWQDAVLRSLITLKALTYAPTGGIIAAPTTSLPEQPGGSRNWDYRYSWLRDASLTLHALLRAGHGDEARAWRDWLLRAVEGAVSEIQPIYGVAGERRLDERTADWLPGYEGSLPVRLGNAAARQVQLDAFGEVMDLLQMARRRGIAGSDRSWEFESQLVEHVADTWRRPDSGIWEMRGEPRHFVHSKVMAWVAVDRAIHGIERQGLDGPLERWRALRQEIHDDVCRHGFDPGLNSFTQSYGSRELDAALLRLPLVRFLPCRDPRVQGTIEAVRERLGLEGFVRRYDTTSGIDALPPGEGAFLLCTLWLADSLQMSGRSEEAREVFERVLALRNDVGLLSEEYDPRARRFLGNFPQSFSHLGLIVTAYNLSEEAGAPQPRSEE